MSKVAVELVFVPSPGIGHLVSTVEVVKMLVDRDECLSVTVLVMNLMPEDNSFIDSFKASSAVTRIRLIQLPPPTSESFTDTGKGLLLSLLSSIDSQKSHVREAVISRYNSGDPRSPRLAGFVVDMFCVSMIDIANEFGVPSYVFYTSSASFLGVNYHLVELEKQHGKPISQIIGSDDSEIDFPGFVYRLPAKQLPRESRDPYISPYFLGLTKRYGTETKGILVNSFMELESRVMRTVFDGMPPPVYLVGPLLSLKEGGDGDGGSGGNDIVNWLDQQPPASVVFLCFGSRGAFDVEQVREIAVALERSGARFLWSLRRPPPKGKFEMPTEYATLSEALPEGFLDRTANVGKVIGWAPQTQVLAHPAVGGFVTHCGWNSTLESIWFGVPTAAWPVYAEQNFNAFATVTELGTAVEVQMDYRSDGSSTVGAEKIEGAIRRLMDGDCEERKRMKRLSVSSREALEVDGSSYKDLGRFIADVFDNIV